MTIDTNKLRRLTQAALIGPVGVSRNWLTPLQDFQKEATPSVISEILDRLEAAEKDVALKERVIDALGSELNAVAKERDELRAKIGVVSTEIVHSYPPPSGWLRAIDEALVVTHLGVANASDTYEQAKSKLENLIGFHVDVATDPAVNGGWKLMPRVPDGWKEAAIAWEVCASIHREYGKGKDPFFSIRQGDFVKHANDARAMLAAAPEAKP